MGHPGVDSSCPESARLSRTSIFRPCIRHKRTSTDSVKNGVTVKNGAQKRCQICFPPAGKLI
jgi:hypothetical protein